MTDSRPRREARSEARQPAATNRISWMREDASEAYSGWVSDVATSSIAFVTPTRYQPASGEAIVLTFDAGSQSPQYRSVRVVRTAPHDRFLSLVACRNEPDEVQARHITVIAFWAALRRRTPRLTGGTSLGRASSRAS